MEPRMTTELVVQSQGDLFEINERLDAENREWRRDHARLEEKVRAFEEENRRLKVEKARLKEDNDLLQARLEHFEK